ncbi:hypothetical protein [Rhizobium hidalgonense]|uniref:hypothetical protein n=1 Tax=Rhizobium hidalgonense TaxID=1538159 RepID=UPI0013E2C5F5|nr:hypothetical protein [Rhizobium hidalgonense]
MARLQSPWHSFGRCGIRLPAFTIFVNGKCDETGIDISGKAGLLIGARRKARRRTARRHRREAGSAAGTALCGKRNDRKQTIVANHIARSAVTGKKSTHATIYTHRKSAISLPANIGAPSLWREMDEFARGTSYANRRKKVLLNRHKTGPANGMINGRK